jgi:D-alanine-D-alanine ligase
MKSIAILFGGSSEERLVSVASAQNLAGHFPEASLYFLTPNGAIHAVSHSELSAHKNPFTQAFHPSAPVIAPNLKDLIPSLRAVTLILALHGTEGEDGSLQNLLETHGVTYTGSHSKASAHAFDKKKTKEIAKSHSIPLAEDYVALNPLDSQTQNDLRAFLEKHKGMVLKPQANGSSVGLYLIHSKEDLESAFQKLALSSPCAYLAEAFITGREITVGVWEHPSGELEALPCSEVKVNQGRQFDYEGKYLGNGVQELTPAPLSHSDSLACQALALATHRALHCTGYSRTDMILTDKGPILLEINTLPGLSKASFIPQQLSVKGVTLRTFFEEQILLTQRVSAEKKTTPSPTP